MSEVLAQLKQKGGGSGYSFPLIEKGHYVIAGLNAGSYSPTTAPIVYGTTYTCSAKVIYARFSGKEVSQLVIGHGSSSQQYDETNIISSKYGARNYRGANRTITFDADDEDILLIGEGTSGLSGYQATYKLVART